MNLRCAFCQTPFSIGRNEKLAALQHMYAENLSHYDAHCPRCRRATPVLRQKLELTFPNWREALHELEQQSEASPASESQPEAAPAQKAVVKPEPVPAKSRSRAGAKARATSAQATAASPKGKSTARKKGV